MSIISKEEAITHILPALNRLDGELALLEAATKEEIAIARECVKAAAIPVHYMLGALRDAIEVVRAERAERAGFVRHGNDSPIIIPGFMGTNAGHHHPDIIESLHAMNLSSARYLREAFQKLLKMSEGLDDLSVFWQPGWVSGSDEPETLPQPKRGNPKHALAPVTSEVVSNLGGNKLGTMHA